VSEVPLCSSRQIVNALQRAGFTPARAAAGDHQTFVRVNEDGSSNLCVVVIGQRQVARYTLLLMQAGLTVDEFVSFLH